MAIASVQSTASEAEVRAALVKALAPHGAVPVIDEAGSLVLEAGSVGMAFVAGPFRDAMKMPVRITVTTAGSGDGRLAEGIQFGAGTSVAVEVSSRSTGGGLASGGIIGMRKQKKASQGWLDLVVGAIPGGPQP